MTSSLIFLIVSFNVLSIGNLSNAVLLFREYERDGSSLLHCVTKAVADLTYIALISTEVQDNYLSDEIIKKFDKTVVITNSHVTSTSEVNYIVFSSNKSFYHTILKKTGIQRNVRFLVVWKLSKATDTKNGHDMVLLQEIFSELWSHRIYKVFVLLEKENFDIDIYTYFPYSQSHCNEASSPQLVDTWDSSEKQFKTGAVLFGTNDSVLENLYGCPVKVIVKNQPPDTTALPMKDGSITLLGTGGKILAYLQQRHNFTLDIKLVEDEYSEDYRRDKYGYALSNYSAEIIWNTLRSNHFDLALGVFSYLMVYSEGIEFSHYYLNENFAFYVPCGTVEVTSIREQYLSEFSAESWAFITFLFFFFVFTLKLIPKILLMETPLFSSFWDNIFTLLSIYLENIVKFRMISNTMRLYITLIMFYCTILSVAYKASLKSVLMASTEADSIRTWEELEQSELSITGLSDNYCLLKHIVSKDQPILQRLMKRYKMKLSGEFSEILEELIKKRDTAYFGSESMILFYNKMRNEEEEAANEAICQISQIAVSSPAAPFVMRKGSLFLDIIDRATSRLEQAGHMVGFGHSKVKTTRRKLSIKGKEKPYSVDHLEGIFLLLLAGLGLAAFFFILELLYYHNFDPNRVIVL